MLTMHHIRRKEARSAPSLWAALVQLIGRSATIGLAAVLIAFFLAGLQAGNPLPKAETPPSDPVPDSSAAPLPAEPTQQTGRWDRGRAVRLARADGSVEELSMAEYLWGVVAAEMPASFEHDALCAQAVAARTYTVSLQDQSVGKHENADLCDDSNCCQAYLERTDRQSLWDLNADEYTQKIDSAILETDGLGVLFDGKPIQAVFFSSADGKTNDAVEVWGSNISYLVGVDSPEGDEVPNYHTEVSYTPQQFKQILLSSYPGAQLSDDPAQWVENISYYDSGSVNVLTIGGISLTGAQARMVFELRSTSFSLTWDGEHFQFRVTGYGHGVGMSQYGANAMAKSGSDFREILTWYYTGTEIDYLWD